MLTLHKRMKQHRTLGLIGFRQHYRQ